MLKSKINSSAFFAARSSFLLRTLAPKKYLDFKMEHQIPTNWCWAAVAVSTSKFYDRNSSWTICKLVNDQLGQTDCCNNGSGYNCNFCTGQKQS